MQLKTILLAAAMTLCAPLAAHADTLVIDSVKAHTGVDAPVKGLSMAAVESRYGTPKERIPAVGQPPITRWVYDGYTVYFEGDTVLHSVVNR